MIRALVGIGTMSVALAFVASAATAQLNPLDAAAVRINGYRETGAAFKSINDQLKQEAPAKIMLRASVRRLLQTSRDQYSWFPVNSDRRHLRKTKAKDEIWSDASGFKAMQDRLQKEAAVMAKLVEGGDRAAMQRQAKVLGETCQACHQKYRDKD